MALSPAVSGSGEGHGNAAFIAGRACRVLVVYEDGPEGALLQACLKGHEVVRVNSPKDMSKALARGLPDAVVIWTASGKPLAMEVLHLLRRSQIRVPAVLVLSHPCRALETEALEMGVREFVHPPIRYEDLRKALDSVLNSAEKAPGDAEPPISDFEARQNLSTLVETLNRQMKCDAGANRVFLRSVVKGIGQKTKPRVCLRCPVRRTLGLTEYVFFEHIRDYCAGNCDACDASIQYAKLRQARG